MTRSNLPVRLLILLLAAMTASACAPGLSQSAVDVSERYRLSPEQAVINAAHMESGVAGVFEMVVRGTGRQNNRLFLNSQADYRDQRTLTLVLVPAVEQALANRLGGPVDEVLTGRLIAARGTAKRTRIDFLDGRGQRTGKYYYQTHLLLNSGDDLTVAGELPR